MKKSAKSIVTFAIATLFAAGLAFAAADAAKVENKVAGCCAKAKTEGKTCDHKCCVTAAESGDNCTKCKGSGKIEKAAKKKKKDA